jgi:hypothetical protein
MEGVFAAGTRVYSEEQEEYIKAEYYTFVTCYTGLRFKIGKDVCFPDCRCL